MFVISTGVSPGLKERGWDSTIVDILRKFKPTILADITKWDYRAYYRSHPPPDVIWASPPCRTFTVQAWGRYRDSEGGAVGVRCSTIQAYLRDRHDPTIPKLCADPFHDT